MRPLGPPSHCTQVCLVDAGRGPAKCSRMNDISAPAIAPQEFTAAAKPHPKAGLIHQLFEEQVERAGDPCAIVYEGQSLSYAALNDRANQLARFLREKGVAPDTLVGICVERSLEMVVGLLGILK